MSLKNKFFTALLLSILFYSNVTNSQTKTILNHGLTACKPGVMLSNVNPHSAVSGLKSTSKSINNTVLLTQDFSGTQFPPSGWTMNILTGSLGWSRGVGSQTYASFSNLNTTAANGYAFVNSAGNGGAGGAESTILRTPAINCAGQNYVWLKFNEFFYQWGSSTGDVEVSNNGTTWIIVHSAHTGLGQNQSTANPNLVDINISAWAANKPTVYVRFRWTGANDYYWFVDDVQVYSKSPYDVALVGAANLNEYSVVPKVHYNNQPLALTATAKNVGGAAVSNVKVKFNIYKNNTSSLIHTALSNVSGPLAADSSINLSAPLYTIPLDTGYYISEYIVSMAQQDANTSNDTLFRYFWVSDSLYARDDALYTSSLDGALGISSGNTVIMGQNYKLKVPDKISRVSFYVTSGVVGDTTILLLYSTAANGVPVTLLASSLPYKFTTAGAQWVNLTFSTGALNLDTGTYFIGIKDFYSTNNIGLGYTNVNYNPGKAWIKINSDAWQKTEDAGFPCAYLIRPYLVCAGYKPLVQPSLNVGLCQGSSTVLTASHGASYLWSPDNQTTQAITVLNAGTYSVSVTNIYGCSAVSSPVIVSLLNNPVVNLGHDTIGCGSIVLNAGGPYASYSWSGGTSNNQHLTATTTGLYIVVVTDSHGCVGLDSINVVVHPNPDVDLGQNLLLCTYETATLNAGSGFSNYLWSNNSTNPTLIINGNTVGVGSFNYSVTVTDGNGCKGRDTINVTFQNCLGIDNNGDYSINFYPNPAHDYITLVFSENLKTNTFIEIYDITGSVVFSTVVNPSTTTGFNVKHINNGVYFIKLKTNNSSLVKKLIIE